MKFVILGATGGTGLELVRQSLQRGHSVTALVRSDQRLKPFAGQIAIHHGDLLSSIDLETVFRDHDAILSGFGPRLPLADQNLLQRFASAVTSAMRSSGLRRIVVESTAFLFRDSLVPPTNLVGRLFFPAIVSDASRMEEIFAASHLDWTMLRPPRLTDRPYTGNYRVREGHLPRFGFTISRANVAHCMIRSAEDRSHIQKVIGASN
jgi:putative NADH-flavin reductase